MIKLYKNIALTLVCVILGVMLSWQYESVKSNNERASLENKRLEELKDLLIAEKNNNQRLRNNLEELQKRVDEFEEAMRRDDRDEKINTLTSQLERYRLLAGLKDVKGPGLIITVDDGESYVQDTDLLTLVNELKASEAQAISINEERIVAMSEIRLAGKYIMINGRQMLPPFVVKAIADPDKLENSLRMMNGVVDYLKGWGLKVTIERADNIVIQKVRDDGTVLRHDMLTPVN